MSKKLKYKKTGKFIGIDTGFVQAATLLDIAALAAVESKDYELVTRLAEQWMKMSLSMKAVLDPSEDGDFEGDEHDHDSGSDHPAGPVGFGVTAAQLKEHHDRINK